MIKKLPVLFAFFLICLTGAMAEEPSSYYTFKYYMHQLFSNFNRAEINLLLKNNEIAGIYLKDLLENIDEVKKNMPERNRDATKFDREQMRERLTRLTGYVSELRSAAGRGETGDTKLLSMEVFNTCTGCHEEARLKELFKVPVHSTIFGEYMHKASQQMDLARIYMKAGGDAEENFKLIDYYLDLLKETFPAASISGAVMDRDIFNARLKEVKGINADMLKNVMEKKPVDIERLRRSLNGLCVACHEPEHLK